MHVLLLCFFPVTYDNCSRVCFISAWRYLVRPTDLIRAQAHYISHKSRAPYVSKRCAQRLELCNWWHSSVEVIFQSFLRFWRTDRTCVSCIHLPEHICSSLDTWKQPSALCLTDSDCERRYSDSFFTSAVMELRLGNSIKGTPDIRII